MPLQGQPGTTDLTIDFSDPPGVWQSTTRDVIADVVKVKINGVPCILNSTGRYAINSYGGSSGFCPSVASNFEERPQLFLSAVSGSAELKANLTQGLEDDSTNFELDASIDTVTSSLGGSDEVFDGNFYTYWEFNRPDKGDVTLELFFETSDIVSLDELRLYWSSEFYHEPHAYAIDARNSSSREWAQVGLFTYSQNASAPTPEPSSTVMPTNVPTLSAAPAPLPTLLPTTPFPSPMPSVTDIPTVVPTLSLKPDRKSVV